MSSVLLDSAFGQIDASARVRPRSFDVVELTAFLDGEHAALKAQVRALLSRPDFAYRYDIDRTQYRELIFQRCREVARQGWGAVLFSGADGRPDVPKFLAVFETLGLSDPNLMIKFGLQFGLFGGAILYLGTQRHHDEYLSRVGSMKLVGCYAMTEIGHGSDTRRLQTVARYDRETGEFVIHTPVPSARKQFIGNAAMHAEMAVVFAQLEVDNVRRGVFGFLVPLRHPDGRLRDGVHIADTGPKAGLLGIDNGCIAFDRVRVPRANLLDRFGTVTPDGEYRSDVPDPTDQMQRTMSGGRVAIALGGLSASKAALTIAIRYAERRRQFGREERLLLDYPLHRRRLLPRLAAVYAIDAALKRAATLSGDAGAMTDQRFEELTAVLKAYSTWNAMEALQVCREACGGQGYLAPNRLGILHSDMDPMTTVEGDNSLLYMLAAKMQLRRLRDANRSRLALMSSWFAHRLQQARMSLSMRVARLRDADCLLRLLQLRERALLWRAAWWLSSAASREPGADYQTPLVELSQARAERIALEEFAKRIENGPHGAQSVLALLRDLYALSCLARHSSWYLQERVMSRAQVRYVDARIARLCHQLRPYALSLVDGFAIPDECLGAPIGRQTMLEEI
ncbi:MAG: acyl-CoA dehydrogenase [Sulfurifustaceae bacterium]